MGIDCIKSKVRTSLATKAAGVDQPSHSVKPSIERASRETRTLAPAHVQSATRALNAGEDRLAAARFKSPLLAERATTIARRGLAEVQPNNGVIDGFTGNSKLDLKQAATVLRDNWDLVVGAAGGGQRSTFGVNDLEAVANDRNAPPQLRAAAAAVLADPNALAAIDVAAGSSIDHRYSLSDLNAVIENADQSTTTVDQVVDVFRAGDNFDILDSASNGETDGLVSRGDLQAVADNASLDSELRAMARAALDDANIFNQLDVGRGGARDGLFSKRDLSNINYSPTPESGTQWSQASDQALQDALDRPSFDSELFNGVHQTDRGNCASTAVIKAALDTYGTDVFNDVERQPNGSYNVTLKDGTELSISRQELEAASTAAHFEGDDPQAVAFATLTYAAMAKRVQQLGHEGSQTYAEALRSLNNGENTPQVPRFLGLQDHVRTIDIDDVEGQDGAVVYGSGHALYADTRGGETYVDAWGEQREYDGTNQVGSEDNELTGAFVFET